jgi:hypothetical protein
MPEDVQSSERQPDRLRAVAVELLALAEKARLPETRERLTLMAAHCENLARKSAAIEDAYLPLA